MLNLLRRILLMEPKKNPNYLNDLKIANNKIEILETRLDRAFEIIEQKDIELHRYYEKYGYPSCSGTRIEFPKEDFWGELKPELDTLIKDTVEKCTNEAIRKFLDMHIAHGRLDYCNNLDWNDIKVPMEFHHIPRAEDGLPGAKLVDPKTLERKIAVWNNITYDIETGYIYDTTLKCPVEFSNFVIESNSSRGVRLLKIPKSWSYPWVTIIEKSKLYNNLWDDTDTLFYFKNKVVPRIAKTFCYKNCVYYEKHNIIQGTCNEKLFHKMKAELVELGLVDA